MKSKVLWVLFLCLLSAGAMAQEIKWKVVDADLCSFEVPDDWTYEIIYEAPGNKFMQPRVGKHYSVRGLSWRNEYVNNAPEHNHFAYKQSLSIEMYERLDGKPFPWKELDLVLNGWTYSHRKPKITNYFREDDEICFKMVYSAEEMDGRVRSYTTICYYKEYENKVFQLELDAQTPNFKKIPDLEERFLHIIKSLKVKENDMSK